MRIFVVPIYTSMVLSHNSMQQIILILVAFKMPVYSLFCCGAALFLLLWAVELLLRLVQLSFVEAVMARSVYFCMVQFIFLQSSCSFSSHSHAPVCILQ